MHVGAAVLGRVKSANRRMSVRKSGGAGSGLGLGVGSLKPAERPDTPRLHTPQTQYLARPGFGSLQDRAF